MINFASRLADEATAGQILITQRLHAEVEEDVEVEPIGELTLKGFRSRPPALNVIAVREPAENVSALQTPEGAARPRWILLPYGPGYEPSSR